jgi:type II secretory pathway component PulF
MDCFMAGFPPAQRFVLFQALYQASQSGDNNWDQVVALLSKGAQAAQRAQLDDLAEQFVSGQRIVLDELREGGMFLEWELQFMQLGLAVGNLAQIYLRLAAHYRLLSEFRQKLMRNLWLPLTIVLLAAVLAPLLAFSFGDFSYLSVLMLVVLGLLPLGLGVGLYCLARMIPGVERLFRRLVFAMPGMGSALAQYQSYHFMNHLADCIGAGFSLPQALKQSARRLPESPINGRYIKLAAEVNAGERFSTALLKSGVLQGVAIPSATKMTDAKQASAQLGLAIHQVCEDQLLFWSSCLPWVLLGLLPYITLLNVGFLWR